MDGRIPVNPSGGVLAANPISVTAMARVAEAALQVTGVAGERQVENVRNAVATGEGGTLQFHTVTVLSSEAH
jgi:acetyl-CoA C-acetyltransferase